jgi:L-amino acid N-acyltransferase
VRRQATGPAPASPLTDSNRRPLPYHGSALPTELRGRSPTSLAEQPRPPASRCVASPPVPAPHAYRTRLVERRDADALRAIYNVEVLESTVTFDLVPRSLADQLAWIDEHSGGHPAIVAVDDGEVGGFASLSPYRPRPAYATTVEDSVYVRRDLRGQGVGRLLLGDLVQLARHHGFHSVVGRIVGDHAASIALHTACGFQPVGREREVGRKFNRWLDVVLMQRML